MSSFLQGYFSLSRVTPLLRQVHHNKNNGHNNDHNDNNNDNNNNNNKLQ